MRNRHRKCSLWYCKLPAYALGFCMGHYQNLRRHGDVLAPSEDIQRTLRDMCDDLATAALEVTDNLIGPCPVCGVGGGSNHTSDCPVEKLFMLASQVKSVRAIADEEKVAVESA